jgi:hypothetical protein
LYDDFVAGTGFCAAIEIGEYADIIKAGNAHTTGFFIVIAGSGFMSRWMAHALIIRRDRANGFFASAEDVRAPRQERDN